LAEDVVQEAFLSLVRRRRKLAAIRNFQRYIFRMVRNQSRRLSRKVARQAHEALPEVIDFVTHERAHDAEAAEQVNRALGRLPPEQREVVMLKFYYRMTFKEIASALRISANTAASRYRYALERLRYWLERKDGGSP